MTLIVVFPASNGVVIGSDTQLTRGNTRTQEIKIKPFNASCLWAGSGETHIIQRLEYEFDRDKKMNKKPIENIRDEFGQKIRDCVRKIIELDLRSQFIYDDITLLKRQKIQVIFAGYTNRPVIYRYFNNGLSEIIDKPFAIGIADDLAFALLQKYEEDFKKFDVNKASILLFKILDEAIKVGAYDINFPIDLWVIDSKGARHVEGVERNKIITQSTKLKNDEIKLLIPKKLT
jgi:20S proteasome alpha/beta subunit